MPNPNDTRSTNPSFPQVFRAGRTRHRGIRVSWLALAKVGLSVRALLFSSPVPIL